jgi:hypothetical protein
LVKKSPGEEGEQVKKTDQIFVGGNGPIFAQRIIKRGFGDVRSDMNDKITGFLNKSTENSGNLMKEVMRTGSSSLSVPVPKKKDVKFVIQSQEVFSRAKGSSGKYCSLPKNISVYGDRIAILVDFFLQHRPTNPEIFDLLGRNIHIFCAAVSLYLQNRCPDMKLTVEKNGELVIFSGDSDFKLKLTESEADFFNVHDKNFKCGDNVNQSMLVVKLDSFLKSDLLQTKVLPRKESNILKNIQDIYRIFGDGLSKILGFQDSAALFPKKRKKSLKLGYAAVLR